MFKTVFRQGPYELSRLFESIFPHPLSAWQRAERLHRRSGDPPSLSRGGKRKLTESAREFPKVSARLRPEGSLWEMSERGSLLGAVLFYSYATFTNTLMAFFSIVSVCIMS